MKRRIAVSLGSVLLASLVLVAGVVWAQVTVIPIEGTQTSVSLGPPSKQWMDDEGVLHIRGMVNLSTGQGQDINDVPWTAVGTVELDINMNPVTGTGDLIGQVQWDYTTYGELEGAFGGIVTATSTAYEWIGESIFPHGSGDFAGWQLRANWSLVWGDEIFPMEGFFHIPPGGGGDKAVPAESNTWGSVKALYR